MTFESTTKIPSDLKNLFGQLRVYGYKVTIRNEPGVHRDDGVPLFSQKIKVPGFGKFVGTSTISDEEALVNAGELFKKEFQDVCWLSNLETNTSGKLRNLYNNLNIKPTDESENLPTVCQLKWADVINSFNRIKNSSNSKHEIVQKLIDEKKIRLVSKSREIVNKAELCKASRFEVYADKSFIFTTTVHISDITITFTRGSIEEISKNLTFNEVFHKLKNASKIVTRIKNGILTLGRPTLSAGEIKNVLQEYIRKKVVEFKHAEMESKDEKDRFFRINFLNQTFIGPNDELPFIELFNYLKEIAYYTNDEKTISDCTNDQPNLLGSTLKSHDASLNSVTPFSVNLGIVLSRLNIIAELLTNFISVYNANDTPSQIVTKFMKLEKFTLSEFKPSESRKYVYKMEHSKIGLFVGTDTTLVNAKLHAHRQIFDILYLLVNLVVSVQKLQKLSASPITWLSAFKEMNPQLVKIKYYNVTNSDHCSLAKFKLETLSISFDVKGNSIPEVMRLVFDQIFILLESFYKAIDETVTVDIKKHYLHDEIISKTKLGSHETRFSVPLCESMYKNDSNNDFTSKEKLMELVLRFKQIYSSKKISERIADKMAIMNELYKLNPDFFSLTFTVEEKKCEITKYLVVLVVRPLGSFSANYNHLGDSFSKVFLDVFNRLLLLTEILDELFQVNLNFLTHAKIEDITAKFRDHLWYSVNREDQKVILHLSHFCRIEAYNVKYLAAKQAAFKDLVEALRRFREEAYLNIQAEDNKEQVAIKEKNGFR